MTDRIDHAAEAQKVLAMPTSVWGSPSEMLAGAQVNATLAIVEQLRIGNLIALGLLCVDEIPETGECGLLLDHVDDPSSCPDIAAALGIDHDDPR